MKSFTLRAVIGVVATSVFLAGCGPGHSPGPSPATELLAEHISKAHGFLIEANPGPETDLVATAASGGGVEIKVTPKGRDQLLHLSRLRDTEILLILRLDSEWHAHFSSEEEYVAWLGDLHGFIAQYNPDRLSPPSEEREP